MIQSHRPSTKVPRAEILVRLDPELLVDLDRIVQRENQQENVSRNSLQVIAIEEFVEKYK